MGTIIWNEVSSRSLSLVVERPPDYAAAERDYEATHVPGRNGDLLVDSGSFKNVEQPYDIAFGSLEKDHSDMAIAVSEWLHSASGYAPLEDSYDPDHYRMAYYSEQIELENILNRLGRSTITFSCMPQRFLKSGKKALIFTKSDSLFMNPTRFVALPKITVYGTGEVSLTVNDISIKISDVGGQITLDSDLREAYTIDEGILTSKNNRVSWPDSVYHPFPKLPAGQSKVSFTGEVERIEVIPQWWTP